ncbi:MAG: cell division protein FtsL, partial [Chloroflexi bacterium]|nr:cell division protein FtsL [Chloroflexota bacterium]
RRRISRFTVASFALLAVGVVGLVQVLQTTHVAATGYEVRALEREQQNLDADIRLLEAQIAASSNLDRIQKDATTRLGMVRPEQRVRVATDVPSPAIVPLPRRYVPAQEFQEPPGVAWWERMLEVIPGLH